MSRRWVSPEVPSGPSGGAGDPAPRSGGLSSAPAHDSGFRRSNFPSGDNGAGLVPAGAGAGARAQGALDKGAVSGSARG